MKPIERLNAASITVTTAVIIWLLKQATDYQAHFPIFNKTVIKVTVFAFISGTLYKQLLNVFIWAGKKSNLLKRMLLGKDYMHGTWAGFYIGASKKVRFFVERYDQGLDDLMITGRSIDESGTVHSDWQSKSYNINSEGRNISYMYEVTSMKQPRNNNGIAFYIFDQPKKAPKCMHGYSTDEHIGVRTVGMEKKIADHLDISNEEVWETAKALFAANAHHHLRLMAIVAADI